MSDKVKRVNRTEEDLREELQAKEMMDAENAFWSEIKEVETKHNRKIRAFIHPNIVEGIRPVISSTVIEHVTVDVKKAEVEPVKVDEAVV